MIAFTSSVRRYAGRPAVTAPGRGPGDRPLLTDDVFKSYDPRWLDSGDWPSMSDWVGQLHHRRPDVDEAGDVDDWLRRLDDDGVRTVCSSGSWPLPRCAPARR